MNSLATLIGKPWAAPCDPPNSFECWELVRHVRALYGFPTPSVVDRAKRRPKHRDHIATPPSGWTQVDEPKTSCVVRFGTKHVGVYIGDGNVIHSQRGVGVRIDKLKMFTDVTFWEQDQYVC